MVILVTGGARSGKSTFAERYAAHLGSSGKYIATAQVYDEEMGTRVRRHLERRELSGFTWDTIEEPYDLSGELRKLIMDKDKEKDKVTLVDCLTLWLSNWLIAYENENEPESKVWSKLEELTHTLSAYTGTIILVTNEVGDGIVPEYPLGRQFRDLAGVMNQRIASISEQVFLVTAGIPMELKSREFKFGE